MLETIVIYYLALRAFLALGCMVYSFRISRIYFASTVTYRFYTVGYFLLASTYVLAFFYSADIATIFRAYDQWLVWLLQGLQVAFLLCIFIGLNRKFYAVQNIKPPTL